MNSTKLVSLFLLALLVSSSVAELVKSPVDHADNDTHAEPHALKAKVDAKISGVRAKIQAHVSGTRAKLEEHKEDKAL